MTLRLMHFRHTPVLRPRSRPRSKPGLGKAVVSLAAVAAALLASPVVAGDSATASNRRTVERFAGLFYGKRDVRAAFERFVAPDYVQHSPGIADGRDAAIAVLSPMFANPALKVRVVRILVDGDYAVVLLHVDAAGHPAAIVDLFRLSKGRIVEHWDVNEPFPSEAVNPHPLF